MLALLRSGQLNAGQRRRLRYLITALRTAAQQKLDFDYCAVTGLSMLW